MNSPKEETILHVANNILSSMNIQQLNEICRDFAFLKAEQYYDAMKPEERKELDGKVAAFVAEQFAKDQKEALKAQPEVQPS